MKTNHINITNTISIGNNQRFALLAGPCAIESEQMTIDVAAELKEICTRLQIPFIFKSSFDKANRTSITSPRGIGFEKGLETLNKVKTNFNLPIVTDVHESWQCPIVAEVADIIQIPAFLCRQTDLLIAAAETGRAINVKKGQFLAPWDMQNVVNKLRSTGNERIMICERGTSFGYNNLVVDMTGLIEMRQFGAPIVFDATHSVQKPAVQNGITGGNREMVPHLMRAALAIGVDAIFAEVHPNPDKAFSDAANQLKLSEIEKILLQAIEIDNIIKKNNQ